MKIHLLLAVAAASVFTLDAASAQMGNSMSSAPTSGTMSSGSMSSGAMSSDSMSSQPQMKMSAASQRKMTKCQAMSHDMMMKNKTCMKMMKMHPEMSPTG